MRSDSVHGNRVLHAAHRQHPCRNNADRTLTGDDYHRPVDKLSNAGMLAAVERLEALLPGLLHQQTASTAMDVFAKEVEAVEGHVHDEDRPYFRSRVQCMLRDAGLRPGDDEPCDASNPIPDNDSVSQ